MATRHSPLTDETVRALNMIDVVFHDKPRIRDLWHEYFDMLANHGLENPQGWVQRQKKNLELITEMAKFCGYGEAIKHLDADRVYYPVALAENARIQKEMTAAALQFFAGWQAFLQGPSVVPGAAAPVAKRHREGG